MQKKVSILLVSMQRNARPGRLIEKKPVLGFVTPYSLGFHVRKKSGRGLKKPN